MGCRAAGHIEAGETAFDCARREVLEELGVTLSAENLRPVTSTQRTDGTTDPVAQRVEWFFTASEWTGEPSVQEPHKCAGVAWFPLDDLPAEVADYERLVLEGLATGGLAPITSFGF